MKFLYLSLFLLVGCVDQPFTKGKETRHFIINDTTSIYCNYMEHYHCGLTLMRCSDNKVYHCQTHVIEIKE